MAPAVRKFCPPSWRMLAVSCAVFILLSDVLATSEERQCFWCGPLAEQIHRSRRAPSCNSPGENVTTCEPGLAHCAMVATSPPYVESRYCVKFYQDECYSLYCSSTKTWRMTCPCRGDFCNGEKTERESEAFARLAKLVTHTENNRIKKRTIVTSSSIVTADKLQTAAALAIDENTTKETDNSTYNEDMNNKSQTDETNVTDIANENIKDMNADDISYNKTNDVEMNIIENDTDELATSKESEEQIISVRTPAIQRESREQLISIRTPAIPAMELPVTTTELITNEETIIGNSIMSNEQSVIEMRQENMGVDSMSNDIEYTTETQQIISVRTPFIQRESREQLISVRTPAIPAMELPVTELITDEHDSMSKDVEYTTETPTEISSHGKSINNNLIKPSDTLPTAEALLQNSSPPAISEKPQIVPEQVTIITTHVDSTEQSTLKNFETEPSNTTEPRKGNENVAARNIAKLYLISNCIFYILLFK